MTCPGWNGRNGEDLHAHLKATLKENFFQCGGCHERFVTEAGRKAGLVEAFCPDCKQPYDRDCRCEICGRFLACYVCRNGVCGKCGAGKDRRVADYYDEPIKMRLLDGV